MYFHSEALPVPIIGNFCTVSMVFRKSLPIGFTALPNRRPATPNRHFAPLFYTAKGNDM